MERATCIGSSHANTGNADGPSNMKKTLSLIHNKMNAYSNYTKMPIFAYQIGNNPKVSAVIGNSATAVTLPEGV